MEKRKCLDCENIIIGRADKKFCCDHCRSNYHNNKNKERYHVVRKLNKQIRSNYRILEKLIDSGCNEVPLKVLNALNFNPHLITHLGSNDGRQKIYDITFVIGEDDCVAMNKD